MDESSSRTHPNLTVYKSTAEKSFPLMLVIGREPNEDLSVSPELGEYDFEKSPRCGLWNMSYSLLAKAAGKDDFGIRGLKKLCIRHGCSPIAIADVLPTTLRDQLPARQKKEARVIPDSEMCRHVDAVLQHSSIIDRVKIVFLSGHHSERDTSPFRIPSLRFRTALEGRGILVVETPFFAFHQTPKVLKAIDETPGAWTLMRDTLEVFETYGRRADRFNW